MTYTKICGLRTKEAIDTSIRYGASYLGFIFFLKSPRNISATDAAAISAHVPPTIKKVAVTVDMTDDQLDDVLKHFNPDYLQLHGKESIDRVKQLRTRYKLPIIKAISVGSKADIATALPYQDVVEYLMFDAKPPKNAILPGGNGVSFDWPLLQHNNLSLPWFLSGGLTCKNVTQAVQQSGATMLDVSSGVESSPGVKDLALIQKFLTITSAL